MEKEHRRPRPTLGREGAHSGSWSRGQHTTIAFFCKCSQTVARDLCRANIYKQLHFLFLCLYALCCLFYFMNICFENTNASGNFPRELSLRSHKQFGFWKRAVVTERSLQCIGFEIFLWTQGTVVNIIFGLHLVTNAVIGIIRLYSQYSLANCGLTKTEHFFCRQ